MPLQNRVDPYGRLFRTHARGTMLGNRGGCIHNEHREIVRAYKSRRWIACVLEFKGRHRVVMTPNRYTELFFLDEAVALTAGHRPCAECRRARYNEFRAAWGRAESWEGSGSECPEESGHGGPEGPRHRSADEMDVVLHPARIGRDGLKVTYRDELNSLPNGTFIELDERPWLVWDHALFLWTPEGYAQKRTRPSATVTVLTPKPIVSCLGNGYVPAIGKLQ
jgi:hypothetical protein